MKYQRLVELYVKPDLRDKIKILKGGQTSDEFLRDLVLKREKGRGSTKWEPQQNQTKNKRWFYVSELTTKDFKKQVAKHPATPNDKIYLLPGRYTCPHCNGPGRKKIIPSLWALIHHVRQHVPKGEFP